MGALTFERMTSDLAKALDLPESEISSGAHLGDLGLDSIAFMRLLLQWQEAEPNLPSERLYECETLGEFWDVIKEAR